MKLLLSLALSVFALLGILDAGYLTFAELTGSLPPCKPPFACQSVLDSPWAKVGPIPLSAFGLLFYSSMFLLGVLITLEIKFLPLIPFRIPLFTLAAVFGILGAGFSLWLIFLMGVVIKAWCLYCLLSALNTAVIFTVTLSLFMMNRADHKKQFEELYAVRF